MQEIKNQHNLFLNKFKLQILISGYVNENIIFLSTKLLNKDPTKLFPLIFKYLQISFYFMNKPNDNDKIWESMLTLSNNQLIITKLSTNWESSYIYSNIITHPNIKGLYKWKIKLLKVPSDSTLLIGISNKIKQQYPITYVLDPRDGLMYQFCDEPNFENDPKFIDDPEEIQYTNTMNLQINDEITILLLTTQNENNLSFKYNNQHLGYCPYNIDCTEYQWRLFIDLYRINLTIQFVDFSFNYIHNKKRKFIPLNTNNFVNKKRKIQ